MKPSLSRLALILFAALLTITAAAAQEQAKKRRGRNLVPVDDGRPPQATPLEQIKVKKDFRVELLYSVPRSEGSWVSMCLDPQGRLIVSDQGNVGFLRVTPPPVGQAASLPKIEPIKLDFTWPDGTQGTFSGAQGLLWAFNSLY